MKKLFFVFCMFMFLCLGFIQTQAQAGDDGFTVTCSPSSNNSDWTANVWYEFPLGFLTWGPESEGNVHPRGNPLLIQHDQIQRADICLLDGGNCVKGCIFYTPGGTFVVCGSITIPQHRDFQIRIVTWSGKIYDSPMDAPGKPISRLWHLSGCYQVQRPDGTWGVRIDP